MARLSVKQLASARQMNNDTGYNVNTGDLLDTIDALQSELAEKVREIDILRNAVEQGNRLAGMHDDQLAPGPCGKHPQFAWKLCLPNPAGGFCTICAALDAERQAAITQFAEKAAAVADNPYSDEVGAYGPDEPLAVGAKIAKAIRALAAEGGDK